MNKLELYNFDFSKKIFYHPEKIVEYKQGRRPFPTTLEIDLTNNCNHKCAFCYNKEEIGIKKASLDTEIIKHRIKEAYELGTRGISFTGGGEPLLHRDFVQIVEYSKMLGFDNGLITNGSLISPKNVFQLNHSLQWIRISMGGGNKDSYAKVQGVDQFERVIDNIKLLVKTKVETKNNLNIGIRVLVSKDNLNNIENLAHILSEMQINYLQLAPDQFTNDGGAFWNDNSTITIFRNVKQILEKNGIMLLAAGYTINDDNLQYPRTCYAHFFQAAVTADGNLTFCKNCRGHDKYYIGNIYNKSLTEIWGDTVVTDLESCVKPNNCGLVCKNMALNVAMEDTLYPNADMSPNFVN